MSHYYRKLTKKGNTKQRQRKEEYECTVTYCQQLTKEYLQT